MSGATNCPETPRQKMISMMYLVLTAMLALNVSNQVLDGFIVVQKNLNQNIASTKASNQLLHNQFEDLNAQNPAKVGEWLEKAKRVEFVTDSLDKAIENLKADIIEAADGPEGRVAYQDSVKNGKYYRINAADNLNAGAQIALAPSMQGQQGNPANVLKRAINAYAAEMCQFVKEDSAKVKSIAENFDTSDGYDKEGERITWEHSMFEEIPVTATITLLTKVQGDLQNTQAEVLRHLKNQVDASDFRVNKISAEVIPVSSYVTRGSTYKARIILAAVDSTQRPKIIVNDKEVDSTGIYEVACSSVGTFELNGKITLARGDGSTQDYPFTSSYIVGEPTAIISADLMNVLYAGFDNPVSVSVPGVPTQNIGVNISNGSMTKSGSGYIIKPKLGEDCNISVSADMGDGVKKQIGVKKFRVKPLPDPSGAIALKDKGARFWGGGAIDKSDLISAKGVVAELKDADIEVTYKVIGYDITYFDSMGNAKAEHSSGPAFTDKQQQFFRSCKKGQTFFINKIKAVGPDGKERSLGSIEVNVKR